MSQSENNVTEVTEMKKVDLRMKELDKYNAIKELVDHSGSKKRVALNLGLTVRQVNRLIIKYKEKGKSRLCAWQSLKKTC